MGAPALHRPAGERKEGHLVEVALYLGVDAGGRRLVEPRDARGGEAVLPVVHKRVHRGVEQPVARKARHVGARDLALVPLEAKRRLAHREQQVRGVGRVHGVAEGRPLVHERVDDQVEERVGTLVAQKERVTLVQGPKPQELRYVLEDAAAKQVMGENRRHCVPFVVSFPDYAPLGARRLGRVALSRLPSSNRLNPADSPTMETLRCRVKGNPWHNRK